MELPPFKEMLEMEPEELLKMQEEITDDIIASAPDHIKPKLNGLKFKITAMRTRHTPMGMCIAMNKLMMDSFLELNICLSGSRKAPTTSSDIEQPTAKVLEFKKLD